MHVVLAYKPILVDVVFEHVKINSMKKQKIKVQQHNTGKWLILGLNWLLTAYMRHETPDNGIWYDSLMPLLQENINQLHLRFSFIQL